MRPHWNRDQASNAEANNNRLRQRYEDRRENIRTDPVSIPQKLKRALCGPRWSGEPVQVTANGRDVAAVLGTEGTDAQAIWRDITAAVQADQDTGTGVRLIPPAPFAEGLRAVAVPSGRQVVVWQSSAESVTKRQRRIAARRALHAVYGHKIPPVVLLSLLVPGWRKAVPIAAVAIATVGVAVLVLAGQVRHQNRWPSSPAVAATHQNQAGTGHAPTPLAPSSSPVRKWRNGRSSQLTAGGTGTLPPVPTPSPGRASARQPRPSPARTLTTVPQTSPPVTPTPSSSRTPSSSPAPSSSPSRSRSPSPHPAIK
jgi:hypothetical protein